MGNDTQTTILIFIINIFISAGVGFIAASMKIGIYKNKVDNLETTVGKDEHGGLRKTVGDMRDKVISCETSLKEREPLTKRRSPISLTERGLKILKASGGETLVDDNFKELLKNIDALKPATAYDVQEDAKKVIDNLREDVRLNPIKDYLFKDGSSLDDAATVMSIYLRDKVLKHKKWNVADIDHFKTTDKSDDGQED